MTGRDKLPVSETPVDALERMPRTQQRGLQGVYKVVSQDRQLVYVGSSTNLDNRRAAHSVAVLLGGQMEVLEYLPEASRHDLEVREDYYIELLKSQGLNVVNTTNLERYRERQKQIPKDVLRANAARGRAAMLESVDRKARSRKSWFTRQERGRPLQPRRAAV